MRAMEYTPVQCRCVELDDLMQVTVVSGLDLASTRLTHGCPLHGLLAAIQSSQKRLTDAECAAELWREHALWTEAFMGRESPDPEVAAHCRSELPVARDRSDTWYRFATHPHASEVEE